MRHVTRTRLAAAEVLQIVRDRPGLSVDEWAAHCGIERSTKPKDLRLWRLLRTHLDELTRIGLLAPTPSGSYMVTPLLSDLQETLSLSLTDLVQSSAPAHEELLGRCAGLRSAVAPRVRDVPFGIDMLRSMEELEICLGRGCNIAVMCLAGKLLEICLRMRLASLGVTADPTHGVGNFTARQN